MGKGLSELQKSILQMAYKNRSIEKRKVESTTVDLYKHEVLKKLFGEESQLPNSRNLGRRYPAKRRYQKSSLGSRYLSVHASVSKSFRRLEERGLVIRLQGANKGWSGIRLTEQGIATAIALAAEDPQLQQSAV